MQANSRVLWTAVISACIAGFCWAEDDSEPAAAAKPEAGEYEPRSEIVLEDVQVTLIDKEEVPALEAGSLTTVFVQVGDFVKENEVLARIDDADAQLKKQRAQIDVKIARVRSENDVRIRLAKKSSEVLQAQVKRSEDAIADVRGAVSKTDLEKERLAVEKADLETEQATQDQQEEGFNLAVKENELAQAIRTVERRQIKSSIAGVVVDVNKHKGEWVEPGTTVFRILKIDRLRVKTMMDFQSVPPGMKGRPVTFVVDLPGRPQAEFPGKVTMVGFEVNAANGKHIEVWAEVENKNLLLLPGLRGTLRINVGDPADQAAAVDRRPAS